MSVKVFSQSESVSRCRNVLESKLKALYGLSKLADEEVTIHQANLEESFSDLRTQLSNQRSVERRQEAEADDLESSALRKGQLTNLVDKLTALKLLLRFQEEEIEKELALKSSIRQKSAAFQIRLTRIDERHNAERNELMMAQNRLQSTVNHIREIELNIMKDQQVVRRKKKENEILAQQTKMQQQKEFEFLREMQIIKIKHLNQINDMEINFTDDMESLSSANRQEEFDLIAKQTVAEQLAFDELDKQKRQMEIMHQVEKQKSSRTQTLRNHKKQEKVLFKQKRHAVRLREQVLLAENPVIQGDLQGTDNHGTSETDDASSHGGSRNDASEDNGSLGGVSDNEEASEKNGETVVSVMLANGSTEKLRSSHDADLDHGPETKMNSERNKTSMAHTHDSEEEKTLASMLQIGRDRIRNLNHHHKKILTDLRALHRNLLTQKQREQRRKTSEVRKEHEEEIEAVKIEQTQSMQELLASQLQTDDARKDSDSSARLLDMMLPAHVIEEIEAGRTPEPQSFPRVTVLFADLRGLAELASDVSAGPLLSLLGAIHSCLDEVLARHDDLYKVENVADAYMVAAGLGDKVTEEEFAAATASAARCAGEMMAAFAQMDLESLGTSDVKVEMRAGLHSGAALAGIVGAKVARYCLFGDAVTTAAQMCTTSFGSRIQVSEETAKVLRTQKNFAITERGEVEIHSKGRMLTYWLSAQE
ncbi:hypothetical protein HK101_003670 [Irineochytrium annulatum]|nr:hypothetical protein HK101_003670 [Irineochytrium annulatum]